MLIPFIIHSRQKNRFVSFTVELCDIADLLGTASATLLILSQEHSNVQGAAKISTDFQPVAWHVGRLERIA